jgi:glycosyltransferase involved in cell wall biosynthesis
MVQMAINRIWFSRFNRVTAISNAVANRLKDCGGDAFHHVEVIYPGTKWTLPRSREELTKDPTIICAGRLVAEKGVDILIRAFAQMHSSQRNTRLIIVGDGPSRTSLMGLADQLGLVDFVDFQGHLSQAGTLAVIRRGWCLCVPSLWEEPFGMIAAEAQMLGVPVIASRAGGLAEIIDEGITGYLVAAGNVDALASRLQMVITNRSLALDLGTESHERAASMFGAEAFAERFEDSYNRLISEVKSQ